MDLSRLSHESLGAVSWAEREAGRRRCRKVNSVFLLVGCLETSPQVKNFLKRYGVLPQRITKRLPRGTGITRTLPPTAEFEEVLGLASTLAAGKEADPLHLLAAMLGSDPECEASRMLRRCGLRQDRRDLLRDLALKLPSLP